MKTRAPGLALTLCMLTLAGCATAPAPLTTTVATTVANTVTPPVTAAASPPPGTQPDPRAATASVPGSESAASAAENLAAQGAVPFAVAVPTPAEQPVLLDAPTIGDNTDLWERVRGGLALQHVDDERTARWTQWYASRPDYVQRMTERGGRYLFHIIEEVERRGLPADLALLPFIESAFNPQAVSRARAAGMWQFMPATGRDFELRQNLFRDDRRDILASTRAALDYLEMLHGKFGDWHLALAAYNWGQGNVQRALRHNERAGLPTSYAYLRMPDETRNYVPKLLAVRALIERPADFALVLPQLDNHPFFLSMPIVRDIDVALVARLSALELNEFHALNPQLNKPVILAAGTPRVLLPYDNAHRFAENLALHRGPMASWTAWVAPHTMQPLAAAKLVGLSEKRLREINRIPPRMLVRKGSTLLVPRSAAVTRDVSEQVANSAVLQLSPQARPARRVTLKAGKSGDSVAAVARRYGLSAAAVARWNGVDTKARFKAGSTIVVMLPPRAPGRSQAKGQVRRAQDKRAGTPAGPRARANEPVAARR